MTDNALTIPQQAENALAFADTKAKLIDLVAGSRNIVTITNADGYKECHSARMALKTTRIEIQKRGKEAREDAVKLQKAVIEKEKELVALIEPEEARLQALQDAVDEAREREKQAKEQAERDRIAAINARFDAIKEFPLRALGMTVDIIDSLVEEVSAIDAASFPEDLQPAATFEIRKAVAGLRAARDAREQQDAEAARVIAEREELARLRAEQEAVAAERERLAEAERQRQAAEVAAKELAERQERERLEAAARAEREAAERAAREAREAEQARIDAERAEARRKEDEARAATAEALRRQQEEVAAERARIDAEKAAQAKRERDAEIANATLQSAAVGALAFLQGKGFGKELVTLKLAAALDRDQAEAA